MPATARRERGPRGGWGAIGGVLLFVACASSPPADAHEFCIDREDLGCIRDWYAGRITEAQIDACFAGIEGECAGARWPAGCAPTQAETGACLALFERVDLLDVPSDELLAFYPECDLCP